VAVVSVSYNTRELTALLLWSLRRIVNWPGLEIVIVDNGSRDGSAELLAEAAQAGVCALVVNDVNRQHGPGLNQGISWLASRPGPAAVFAAADYSHPLYDWATGYHDPHFGEVPGADERYKALLRALREETGPLTGTSLAAACGYPPSHP
jgi:glycosyltransferase involved in cell wall biosynthesis